MKSERGMSGIGSERPWAAPMVRLGLMVLALGAAARAGFSQCNYELLTDANGQPVIIQAPPCQFTGPPSTLAGGLSPNGRNVVGSYADCSISGADWGFFWSPETGFITLPKPANAFAINPADVTNAGLIVGTANITGVGNRGFVYDINNPGPQNYIYLPPKNGVGNSNASAINESNVVVGARSIGTKGINPFNAVIWKPLAPSASVMDLGVLNGPNSSAIGENAGPDAAGWAGTAITTSNCRAYLWFDALPLYLGMLPDTINSHARGLNNEHQAIGGCRTSEGPFRAFRWMKGKMIYHEPPSGYNTSGVGDINDAGQVVGSMRHIDTDVFHMYLWQHGVFHNLGDLLVDPPQSLVLNGIASISNLGDILAGVHYNQKVATVVLTPVNQPLTDLNHDCRTDPFDLLILLDQWGPVLRGAGSGGGLPSADFNEDGRVDVLDLLILLSNWG